MGLTFLSKTPPKPVKVKRERVHRMRIAKNYIYIPLAVAKNMDLVSESDELKYDKIAFAQDEEYFYVIFNKPDYLTKIWKSGAQHIRVHARSVTNAMKDVPLSITPKPYYDGQYFGAKFRKI